MSLGEAPGKFGPSNQSTGPNIGPGPSDLNPAGVFPRSDPQGEMRKW